MSTYSDSENEVRFVQEIEETTRVQERVQMEGIPPAPANAKMTFQEALGYNRLKADYHILEEDFIRQSKELADAQARLDKHVNIDALNMERDALNRELKQAQAEIKALRQANEGRSRHIKSLEEMNTQMLADFQEFQRSVFDLLGLRETTTTKTTRETLLMLRQACGTLVEEKKVASDNHKEETMKLKMRITDLERSLEEERRKVPSVPAEAQASLLEKDKENQQLRSSLEQERSKCLYLSRSVRMYREERERECEQLEQRLEIAHKQMEMIQKNLSDMHQLATQTLTTSASTLPNIDVAKQHRCKYSARIFEASIEEFSTLQTPSPSTEGGRFVM